MDLDARTRGFDELKAKLDRMASDTNIEAALAPVLMKVGADILKDAVRRTPRDRGGLVNSAGVQPLRTQRRLGVTIGYGAVYAGVVHENPRSGRTGGVSPSGQHYRHWAATGEPQFLANAMKAAKSWAWHDVAEGAEAWLRQQGR